MSLRSHLKSVIVFLAIRDLISPKLATWLINTGGMRHV